MLSDSAQAATAGYFALFTELEKQNDIGTCLRLQILSFELAFVNLSMMISVCQVETSQKDNFFTSYVENYFNNHRHH